MKSVLKGIPHLHSKVVSKYEEGGKVKTPADMSRETFKMPQDDLSNGQDVTADSIKWGQESMDELVSPQDVARLNAAMAKKKAQKAKP